MNQLEPATEALASLVLLALVLAAVVGGIWGIGRLLQHLAEALLYMMSVAMRGMVILILIVMCYLALTNRAGDLQGPSEHRPAPERVERRPDREHETDQRQSHESVAARR